MIQRAKASFSQPGNRNWLVTFSDLVALLLTFFVMLFSMSGIDAKNWQALQHSVSGFRPEGSGLLPPKESGGTRSLSGFERHGAASLDYLAPQVRATVAATPGLDLLDIVRLPDRLTVSIGSQGLVDSTGLALTQEGKQSLGEFVRALGNARNRIEVGAHLSPNETLAKADSFGRSFERAKAVAEVLRTAGYAGVVSALGYSSGQASEIAPALPQDQRNRMQTRIDLTIRPYSGS